MAPDAEEERVVWLLGAGFSKPLGGPLFGEIFEVKKWVDAWLKWQKVPKKAGLSNAFFTYDTGVKLGLWRDPETCLAFLSEARSDELALELLKDAFGPKEADTIEERYRGISQFVAISTSFFVDRVVDGRGLPEAWNPYIGWWKALTANDAIVSLNYDRVVEELPRRHPKKVDLFKVHGSVPENLRARIYEDSLIDEIGMPGPGKVDVAGKSISDRSSEPSQRLVGADRLVIVGYSFPATDPSIASWILGRLSENDGPRPLNHVDIVVGPDKVGGVIAEMFRRFFPAAEVRNTGFLAQQFLAEGTIRPGRFRHDHKK